ncbi:MAG: hypothetical protein ABIH11_03880 [Candidatus Altiarchaeota archaeon]
MQVDEEEGDSKRKAVSDIKKDLETRARIESMVKESRPFDERNQVRQDKRNAVLKRMHEMEKSNSTPTLTASDEEIDRRRRRQKLVKLHRILMVQNARREMQMQRLTKILLVILLLMLAAIFLV